MQAKLFKFIESQIVLLVLIVPVWGCVNATRNVKNLADCFEDTVTVTVDTTGEKFCIPIDDLK